jgi:hypothetical protein
LASAGAAFFGAYLACAELTAELLLELFPLGALLELLDLLLEPQAATPSEAIARSPGINTPSNLGLDLILLPFVGRTFTADPPRVNVFLPAGSAHR